MLTYPDRQKFAEIRAQWERAQPLNSSPASMVGRKEKAAAQQTLNTRAAAQQNTNTRAAAQRPPSGEIAKGAGSNFRRKLSHGLSFISHPLAQRRVTPGRQPSGRQALGESGTTNRVNITAAPRNPDIELSPLLDSTARTSVDEAKAPGSPAMSFQSASDSSDATINQSSALDATPKALPRSRTMSFIPRPARSASESSSREVAESPTPRTTAFTLDPQARATATPTKIPSPSPPHKGPRRRSSPRQYTNHTTQQEKHIAAGAAFAGVASHSPGKSPIKSYTTSNLLNGSRPPQPGFMIPRKSSMMSKPSGTPPGESTNCLTCDNRDS